MSKKIRIFFITFILVLAAGMVFILLYAEKKEEKSAKTVTEETAVSAASVSAEDEVSVPVIDLSVSGNEDSVSDDSLLSSDVTVSEDAAGEETRFRKEDHMEDPAVSMEMFVEPASDDGSITIGFAGDVLFDPSYAIYSNFKSRGSSVSACFSERLLSRMRGEDVMILNNEFPYSDRGTPAEGKTFTFRAKPSSVETLHELGVDAVSLANNHGYDFGVDAFTDSLDVLEGAGIPHLGGGRNAKEAARPLYIYTKDMKIAVVAATQIERYGNPHSMAATDERPGMLRCFPDIEPTLAAIREAKENSDYVILFVHWGTENEVAPDWGENEQLPKFIEAGVDCVIGAHPHILQPVAYSGDVPVVYSLGNFWFNSKTLDTGMVELKIKPEGLESLKFIPCRQKGCAVKELEGTEAAELIGYMRGISPTVDIDDEGYITKK